MRLLPYEELEAKGIRFTKQHLWRLVRAKKFPKPIKVGVSRNAWVEEEIDAYIKQRIEERDREGVA